MPSTVRKATFYSILDRAVQAVGKLLVILLIARLLGPEGQGVYAFALALWVTSSTLTTIGAEVANSFYGAKQQVQLTANLFGNSLIFGLVLGLVGGVILFALTKTPLFPPEFIPYAILLSVGAPVTVITALLGGLLMGTFGFFEKLLASALLYLGCITTIICLAVSNLLDTQHFLLYWIVWQALSTLVLALALLRKSHYKILFDLSVFKDQIRYGTHAYLYNLSNALTSRFDALVIAYFLGPAALGLYSVAVAATEVIMYLPTALSNVLLSSVSLGKTVSIKIYHTMLTLLILAATACTIAAFVLFPHVLGPEFSSSSPLVAILAIGTVGYAIGGLAAYHLFGLNKGILSRRAAILSMIFVVIGDVVLIPYLGLLGAAFASTLAYTVFGVLCLRFLAPFLKAKTTDFLRFNAVSLCKDLLRASGPLRWRWFG